MANTNAPFGFRPIKRLDGAAWSGNLTQKKMQNNAGACNRGDVVKQMLDGTVAVSGATSGSINIGVADGFRFLSSAMGYPIWTNYWPGAGAVGLVDAFIIDDPLVVFEVMAATGPITLADVGANADVVVAASTTGFSKWALGTPSAAAGSDVMPFKVVGVGNGGVPVGDGYDATAANNIVEVAWANHHYKTFAVGV